MLSSQCTRVQAWFLLLCTLCRTQRGDYWEEGHRQQFLRRSVEIEISSRQGDSCSKERSNEAGFEFINIFSNVPPSLSHLKSLTLTATISHWHSLFQLETPDPVHAVTVTLTASDVMLERNSVVPFALLLKTQKQRLKIVTMVLGPPPGRRDDLVALQKEISESSTPSPSWYTRPYQLESSPSLFTNSCLSPHVQITLCWKRSNQCLQSNLSWVDFSK